MLYVKNVPNTERALRVLIGLGVAIWAVLGLGGLVGWLVAGSAAMMVTTGLIGFCPACALVGRKLQ